MAAPSWCSNQTTNSAMSMRVLSVLEITAYLKELIECDPVLSDIWVRGEVTNFSRSAAGHIYFSLTSESLQISCVLFRGKQKGLLAMPRNGEEVLVHGRITLYEMRGQYQVMVDNVAPLASALATYNSGSAAASRAEGLFAPDRKRPLRKCPQQLASSPRRKAQWHDIRILSPVDSAHRVDSPPAPCKVGRSADLPVRSQARRVRRYDIIIIGRGSARPNLAAFGDEGCLRDLQRTPIVSAVGHGPTPASLTSLPTFARRPECGGRTLRADRDEIVAQLGFG